MTKNKTNISSSSQDFLQENESFADKLLNELFIAQKELGGTQEDSHGHNPCYFVIAKLMRNLDMKTWKEVRKMTLSEGWCALELDRERSPIAWHLACTESASGAESEQVLDHLLLSASFFKHLEQEVERAKRSNTFLTLGQLSLQDEHFDLEKATRILHAALKEHAAECDRLGILNTKNFALIIPGANAFKAQLILDDVLEFCQEKQLSLHVGIASHLGGDETVKDFLEHAHSALLDAQQQRKALCIYKKPSNPYEDRLTLVHSHEKRFLFGDSDEV